MSSRWGTAWACLGGARRARCDECPAVSGPVGSLVAWRGSRGARERGGTRCWASRAATLSPPTWRQDGMAIGALLPGIDERCGQIGLPPVLSSVW